MVEAARHDGEEKKLRLKITAQNLYKVIVALKRGGFHAHKTFPLLWGLGEGGGSHFLLCSPF